MIKHRFSHATVCLTTIMSDHYYKDIMIKRDQTLKLLITNIRSYCFIRQQVSTCINHLFYRYYSGENMDPLFIVQSLLK